MIIREQLKKRADYLHAASQESGDGVNEDSKFAVPDSNSAIREAKTSGLVPVFPGPNQLQIDIDNDVQFAVYKKNKDIVHQYWGIVHELIAPSKSGGERKHITLTLKGPVGVLERIGLQAVLGSDLKREQFSLVRVLQNDAHPTLFFEKETKEK